MVAVSQILFIKAQSGFFCQIKEKCIFLFVENISKYLGNKRKFFWCL